VRQFIWLAPIHLAGALVNQSFKFDTVPTGTHLAAVLARRSPRVSRLGEQEVCEVFMVSARRIVSVLLASYLAGSPALAQKPTPQPPDQIELVPPPSPVLEEVKLPAAPTTILAAQKNPIDLASALQLAGVQNAEILLAREQVTEAIALRQLAAAQFLPTLNAGTNVDTHSGPLQRAAGQIIEVNRGAMFLGLGAAAVGAGTVMIPGILWNGNLSQTYFNALMARQVVRVREFNSLAVRNDVLLRVANGYLELLRAEGRLAIAETNRKDAAELARLTGNWTIYHFGRQSDFDRTKTVLAERDRELLDAENGVLSASARLAALLDLDPAVRLQAIDGWVVPAPIVPDPIPLSELIAIALAQRPELQERRAAILAAMLELRSARLLPFSPNLLVGYSAGTFGGGSNLASEGILQANGSILQQSRFGNFDDRQDFDAVLFWTLHNLGVGNVALVRLARSNLRQDQLRQIEVLDRVRTEVATAYARAHARFAQIETGERALTTSELAYKEDLDRTKNRFGLLIETVDSLRLLHRSRYAYLDAIVDYNQAQFALYVALGQPPARVLARPIPESLVPAPRAAVTTAKAP
jgi:outer membrane protein TolC